MERLKGPVWPQHVVDPQDIEGNKRSLFSSRYWPDVRPYPTKISHSGVGRRNKPFVEGDRLIKSMAKGIPGMKICENHQEAFIRKTCIFVLEMRSRTIPPKAEGEYLKACCGIGSGLACPEFHTSDSTHDALEGRAQKEKIMTIAHFLIGFLMIVSALFAIVLTLRGYDWAIDKFEHLLFKADYPARLGDKISKKIIRS